MNALQRMNRRHWLAGASSVSLLATLGSVQGAAANSRKPWTRPFGAAGERLPVIGIGTNRFRLESVNTLREVLRRMGELGGTVIDTAAAYGESEETIGTALADLADRSRFFLATKLVLPAPGASSQLSPAESFERSLKRLRTDRVDLLQVHNLQGTRELMPMLREWRSSGRIRYLGLTTSRTAQHEQLVAEMNEHAVDFIQVDYSLINRVAAERVLPAAAARKVAVLVNLPLGGGRGENLVRQAGDRPLPKWALRAGIRTWAQFGLAYVVAHPAVTCAIPGSTQLRHLEDNQSTARIAPLDASLRRRMEEFWDREIAPGS